MLSYSPSQVRDTDCHSDSHTSLDITTRTSSSPRQHNSDTREDATGRDHGTGIRNAGMTSRSCIKNGVSSDGHRRAENDEGSTEFHVIGDDSDDDGEEACGDVWWCGEELSGSIGISELIDNLEGNESVLSGLNRSKGATHCRDEEGECVDWYQNPDINDDLEPALPVGERLVDKLLVVVGSKIGRVMLEALHYELTLFGSEELGGRWILKGE
jgi:hypothetical protein